MSGDESALQVLIVAPIGRDAAIMFELLESNGHRAHVCGDLRDAALGLKDGAGALLLTEESLNRGQIATLLQQLDEQPAWSELPVIILSSGSDARAAERLGTLAAAAGTITVLERPLGTATLLRTIEVALRSRRRQYEVHGLLDAQRAREAALRDSEERLRLAIVALAEANQRKDAFLATLSHELRNPLAPIRTAAEVLASPHLTPIQLRWSQGVIQRQSEQMAWLLDDLLELTRITQGKLRLRRADCTLRGVVDAAVETARPLLEAKGHELHVNLSDPGARFGADPVRLSQALSNLLTNAAKYTDAGGSIELSGRVEDEVSIAVEDNGIGIRAEQIA